MSDLSSSQANPAGSINFLAPVVNHETRQVEADSSRWLGVLAAHRTAVLSAVLCPELAYTRQRHAARPNSIVGQSPPFGRTCVRMLPRTREREPPLERY